MAAELARHGVRCRIVDRLERSLPFCRAIGVTPRTLEVWEDMGVVRDMIDAGLWLDGLRSIIGDQPPLDSLQDLSDLPYAQLGLPQYETERLLTAHLARFGVAVERGIGLKELEQAGEGVAVKLESSSRGAVEEASFRYVIGCDGAHSTVRHAVGIAFEGEAFPMTFMLGDVHIAWDLPRGMALRAVRPVEDAAPEMFIAIPLPDPGRYRVSMLAPDGLAAAGGSAHGIQSELKGPELGDIQAVADRLLADRPRVSDLRWSSLFRISMRLAAQYRCGRVFIAGDAAHIHPPTGGQGMNTGIQDAYNLAWKLGLVLRGLAPEELLDSYEAERRPVGAEVVARTRAASEGYGRERGKPDRLADTQILVSYRGAGVVPAVGPAAGDRAPDAAGLRRHGVGFPLRLHEVVRGTEHVLVAHVTADDVPDLAKFARGLRVPVRVVAIVAKSSAQHAGIALYDDAAGSFAGQYGPPGSAFLIRPDGYVGWRGETCRDATLAACLARTFR
jgi:2-polyprenyl-6-methoxyphenol hydroxylase-like FAD-dependent oxidoreductase